MTTIVIGVTNHSSPLAACNRAFELAAPPTRAIRFHPRLRGRPSPKAARRPRMRNVARS